MDDDVGLDGLDGVDQGLAVEAVDDDRRRAEARSSSAFSGERVVPVTVCPRSVSWGINARPTAPVAPAMKMFMQHRRDSMKTCDR